ncbi:glycosyltransferase family 2 protein, partial [bacterium]|nr:glycosyltransferase family 2 protein [bacterium]MDC3180251.1 glycosyltransferase family 2 protein [bacterium]
QIESLIAQEKERAKMALVFFKKHSNLRVRFMIQLTPLHKILWQILNLGGLISVDRILPLLRFLVNIRRNRLALEILRIPLNMIYIKELTKTR